MTVKKIRIFYLISRYRESKRGMGGGREEEKERDEWIVQQSPLRYQFGSLAST